MINSNVQELNLKHPINKDALLEVRNITKVRDKPASARSNNLEAWLSKKKAFDQQSK